MSAIILGDANEIAMFDKIIQWKYVDLWMFHGIKVLRSLRNERNNFSFITDLTKSKRDNNIFISLYNWHLMSGICTWNKYFGVSSIKNTKLLMDYFKIYKDHLNILESGQIDSFIV